MGDRTRKLVALRARTDHDLLVLVRRELESGFAQLARLTSRQSPVFTRAQKALSTVETLLPRILTLTPEDKKRIEQEMEELRLRLASVPVYATAFPASAAS